MTVGLVTALRNARLDQITTKMDAGAGPGLLRIYDGTRPGTGGAGTVLLAELTLADPSAPAAAGGLLTLNAIIQDAAANAGGTATWARVVDSAFVVVLDCSVAVSGADLNLNTVAIVINAVVSVTSAVFTEGNP